MCRFTTSLVDNSMYFVKLSDVIIKLKELENDGMIKIYSDKLEVTQKGRAFVRNVCLPFDMRLQRNRPQTQLFSMTV